MAASQGLLLQAVHTFLCLSSIFIEDVNTYSAFPTREVITKWADLFQNRILQDLDQFTGIKNLEKSYYDLRKANLVKVDGRNLVHKMSHDFTKHLEKKMAALERLVNAAETSIRQYKYDQSIVIEDVEFVKMKELTENDPRLVFSEKYKRGVNFTYSGVHIPVEIWEKNPEILNGLKWSGELDVVFRENLKQDPDLLWQNFGSQSGFMRVYPARVWVTRPRPDFPDLYDVRLSPWYVHTSSSPKDMLILMDSSGSMHGQTMEIMKIAVKTLLTTLGENDFVNVASFSSTTQWVTCLDTFVQATRRNKQILSKGIDELSDKNMAKLSDGLEFAFKEFEKFSENKTEPWAGSHCNKVIMLFSDGGTEEAWDVLKEYNSDKKIRIFTYSVGPHPVPYATLKEIACTNRGFFTEIQAMGAVRTAIQDYVKVLGRTLVLSGEKNFRFSNFFVDPMGLGMMTTITLPVFNTSEGANQSVVGVMGVGLALSEALDFEPSYEIGPVGYSFGLSENGYVVFHPDLKPKFETMDDSLHLDFLDVEIENTVKEELRRSMLNFETGKKTLTSLLKMPDGKHIVRHHMEYYFTPLNKTTFSIAIVMPTDRLVYLVVDGMDYDKDFAMNAEEMEGVHLAPWKYCYGTVMKSHISTTLKNLSNTLRDNPEMCKIQLLQRLIWDIRKTEDIVHYWHSEQRDGKRDGVIATFVQSEGGLTRIYPPSEEHHLKDQTNPSRSLIFQRAFYGSDYVFLPPENEYDSSSNQSDLTITIVKTISFHSQGSTCKPAVVGVLVDPMWLQPYLLSTPSGAGKVPLSCADVDDIVCYLIDDGGFIISTNQNDLWSVLGKFLGIVDSEIMTELYEKSIFARNEDFNYNGRCKKKTKVSAGVRISPLQSTISALNLGWLFDIAAWSQIKYWILSFLTFVLAPQSQALPEFFELPNETACNMHEAQYFLDRWGRSYSAELHCNNCTRQYSLAKVGDMNVLLLVTTKPCSPLFCDLVPPLLQAPEEIVDLDNSTCNHPLRYRRRPEHCYAYSTEENTSECGAVGTLELPHVALVIELLCLLLVTKLVHAEENIVPFAPH